MLWINRTAIGKAVAACILIGGLTSCDAHTKTEAQDQQPTTPVTTLAFEGSGASNPNSKVAHGDRVSRIVGCKACHGETLQGQNVTAKEPEWGDMYAPNLTLLMASYSDAELERAIRKGVPKDGRTMWFMPSESLQFLSDADLSALVAYLRTMPPGGKPTPPIRKGALFHQLVKAGQLHPAPKMVERFQARQPADMGERHALGRYIAKVVCSECHNAQLEGLPDFSPSLDITGAFDQAELIELLTTGKGKSKPDLGLMIAASRLRFSQFTPGERQAVVAYLQARTARPQQPH
jgi:mono/diheme cytochrome c family protein